MVACVGAGAADAASIQSRNQVAGANPSIAVDGGWVYSLVSDPTTGAISINKSDPLSAISFQIYASPADGLISGGQLRRAVPGSLRVRGGVVSFIATSSATDPKKPVVLITYTDAVVMTTNGENAHIIRSAQFRDDPSLPNPNASFPARPCGSTIISATPTTNHRVNVVVSNSDLPAWLECPRATGPILTDIIFNYSPIGTSRSIVAQSLVKDWQGTRVAAFAQSPNGRMVVSAFGRGLIFSNAKEADTTTLTFPTALSRVVMDVTDAGATLISTANLQADPPTKRLELFPKFGSRAHKVLLKPGVARFCGSYVALLRDGTSTVDLLDYRGKMHKSYKFNAVAANGLALNCSASRLVVSESGPDLTRLFGVKLPRAPKH